MYIQIFLNQENDVLVRGVDRINHVSDWEHEQTNTSGQTTTTFDSEVFKYSLFSKLFNKM